MIREGQPLRVVAETFGISVSKASILSCSLASRIKAERDEEIRHLRGLGWTHRALAKRFSLSRIRVMRICAGRTRRAPRVRPRTGCISGSVSCPARRTSTATNSHDHSPRAQRAAERSERGVGARRALPDGGEGRSPLD